MKLQDLIQRGKGMSVFKIVCLATFNRHYWSHDIKQMEEAGLLFTDKNFAAMRDCQQKKKHHPEGNVWEHTKLVVAQAQFWRSWIPNGWGPAFLIGALLHDIGKPDTVDKELSCINHDNVGAKLAKQKILEEFGNKELADQVYAIVRGHMRPRQLTEQKSSEKAWRKLNKICRLDVLAYMSVCDSDGRDFPPKGTDNLTFKTTMEYYEKFKNEVM